MGEMEDKLETILGNPQMMQSILQMAQQIGGSPAPEQTPPPAGNSGSLGSRELDMIHKIASFSQQAGLDGNEQQLLQALHPYLSGEHVGRLEKAMHAAKLASFASAAMSANHSSQPAGR